MKPGTIGKSLQGPSLPIRYYTPAEAQIPVLPAVQKHQPVSIILSYREKKLAQSTVSIPHYSLVKDFVAQNIFRSRRRRRAMKWMDFYSLKLLELNFQKMSNKFIYQIDISPLLLGYIYI